MAKRFFDLAIVFIATPLWLPLLVVLTILVRLKLGRPVFFRQKRGGKRGGIFEVIKFRTMLDIRDSSGRLLPDAQRLTPFGRWLRGTSLDELPELFNVIMGDMSLVGPRPLRADYLPLYTPRQHRRHDALPGITGLAQVKGRNALSWEEKFEWDLRYVEKQSISLDIRILALTLKAVVMREGISAAGEATMPEFRGNIGEQRTLSDA